MQSPLTKLLILISLAVVLSGCLEEVKFIPKMTSMATLAIVRDGGDEGDPIDVFVDSFLVGQTYQDGISFFEVPSGKHYIFFAWEDETEGLCADFEPASSYAMKQFVLNAYAYKQFNNDTIADDHLTERLGNPNFKQNKFSYADATRQMNTKTFSECVGRLETPFELQNRGFRIRIKD